MCFLGRQVRPKAIVDSYDSRAFGGEAHGGYDQGNLDQTLKPDPIGSSLYSPYLHL